jgi:hypothetical protein
LQVVFVQVAEHTELLQKGAVVGQAMPHAPQFVALDLRSTQVVPHVVYAQVAAGAPPEPVLPPVPGALPLPPVPGPPGELLAEQLRASKAGNASVSVAPTSCGRIEPDFSRNRFHIGAPNLKSSKARGGAPPRRNSACFTLLPL